MPTPVTMSSMETTTALQVARFAGKNWPIWKTKIQAYFEDKELSCVVEYPIASSEAEVRALLLVRSGPDAEEEYEELLKKFEADANLKLEATKIEAEKIESTTSSSSSQPAATAKKKKTPTTGKDIVLLVKKSKAAFRTFVSSLSDDLILLINSVAPGDAHGVWKILLAKYERKTMASLHHTRGKLLSMRMEASESFDAYLARIQEIRAHSSL